MVGCGGWPPSSPILGMNHMAILRRCQIGGTPHESHGCSGPAQPSESRRKRRDEEPVPEFEDRLKFLPPIFVRERKTRRSPTSTSDRRKGSRRGSKRVSVRGFPSSTRKGGISFPSRSTSFPGRGIPTVSRGVRGFITPYGFATGRFP